MGHPTRFTLRRAHLGAGGIPAAHARSCPACMAEMSGFGPIEGGEPEPIMAGIRGKGPYKGVIRLGGAVVWACPHDHGNRDHETSMDTAARSCARTVLEALERGDGPLRAFERFMETNVARREGRTTLRHLALLEWALSESRALSDRLLSGERNACEPSVRRCP